MTTEKIDLRALLARRLAEKQTYTAPSVRYNAQQQQAIRLASEGKNFCLTGAAGTGKTTTESAIIEAVAARGLTLAAGTKHLREGSPAIVIVAFTNRAVRVAQRMARPEFQSNYLTIHKLLEFEPVFTDKVLESGEIATQMEWIPARNEINKLPESLRTVLIDEASMVGTTLEAHLIAALHPTTQIIYVGDINQLPPVGEQSAFGYALARYPIVELVEVYRQAAQSGIISLAHAILSGVPLKAAELKDFSSPDVGVQVITRKTTWQEANVGFVSKFKQLYQDELYRPLDDMIIVPFNKRCGTLEINLGIAQFLTTPQTFIHEVIAGYEYHYFALGDKIIYDKREWLISKIADNRAYGGRSPRQPSTSINRWGVDRGDGVQLTEANGAEIAELDDEEFHNLVSGALDSDDKVNQASSAITLDSLEYEGNQIVLTTTGEINSLAFGYAMTCHKCQGGQWDKVFLIAHESHAIAVSREWLYTAVTRAAKRLEILCDPLTFFKGIKSQRLKGDTAAEKMQYFIEKIAAQAETDVN